MDLQPCRANYLEVCIPLPFALTLSKGFGIPNYCNVHVRVYSADAIPEHLELEHVVITFKVN